MTPRVRTTGADAFGRVVWEEKSSMECAELLYSAGMTRANCTAFGFNLFIMNLLKFYYGNVNIIFLTQKPVILSGSAPRRIVNLTGPPDAGQKPSN